MEEIRIYIADDYFLFREGLKRSLKDLREVVIVGESSELKDLPSRVKASDPHIVILELNLCDRPVGDLIRDFLNVSPNVKVLIISDCLCELPIVTSIRGGISGFIRKNVSRDELLKAIREIYTGNSYFAPEITQVLMKGVLSDKSSGYNFTDREFEILRYICKGRSNEQIADLIFISEKTIATHRRNIMRKAKVKKTSDLIIWAMENNIIKK